MEITQDDVTRVAQLMGKDFSDEERSHVICFLKSGDVQACPGSGKTTAMVAKLLILAEKLAGSLTGICALSHTNVAKNEIRQSFGSHSYLLLRYPHFVGTIQSFIDQFLAIPAYIQEFGHRPLAIDDELYENVANKIYSKLPYKTRFALDQKTHGAGKDVFFETSYSYQNFELVRFGGNRETPYYFSNTTPTYQEILKSKQEITGLGYLTFHDAFAYANRYLTKYPGLADVISKRFSFVFIDEMQDTDSYQNELLERLFRNRTIIQRFGDPNQTIYGHKSENGIPIWHPGQDHAILSSRRLSPSISRISQGICSERLEIHGNDELPTHPHTVILFDQRTIENVIPQFGRIIRRENLSNGPFKAVGAVGRPNQNQARLSITSYWPSFEKRQLHSRANDPFWGFISQVHTTICTKGNYSEAYLLLVKALTEVLRLGQFKTADGRLFTPSALLNSIHEQGEHHYDQFRQFILSTCEALYQSNNLDIDFMVDQVKYFIEVIGFTLDTRIEDELRVRGRQLPADRPADGNGPNIYLHEENIQIEINTIHSVKGQTHQATLVMETYYRNNDLPTILPYLVGEKKKNPGVTILYRFLPLIYVACTRPSHLLCLALDKGHISEEDKIYLHRYGWVIDDLTG